MANSTTPTIRVLKSIRRVWPCNIRIAVGMMPRSTTKRIRSEPKGRYGQ